MAENNFTEAVDALFKGMDALIASKTVIGEQIKFDDGTIIVPFVDVNFALGAGAFKSNKQSASGGMGGKVSPNCLLVIKDGKTRLVNIKNQDSVTRLFDMIPDVIDKFKKSPKAKAEQESEEMEMERKARKIIRESKKNERNGKDFEK